MKLSLFPSLGQDPGYLLLEVHFPQPEANAEPQHAPCSVHGVLVSIPFLSESAFNPSLDSL